ncbi:MAG: type II toxin-antitoxin system HicB family antitoxin [Conexivisphaerales archaeon]
MSTIIDQAHQNKGTVFEIKEGKEVIRRRDFRVVIEKGLDGWLVARCLDVKGAISQGRTLDEAYRNITEAVQAVLDDMGSTEQFNLVIVSSYVKAPSSVGK